MPIDRHGDEGVEEQRATDAPPPPPPPDRPGEESFPSRAESRAFAAAAVAKNQREDINDDRQEAGEDSDRGTVDAPSEAVDEPRPGIGDQQSDETLRPAEADTEDQNVDIRATPKHEGSDAVERQYPLGKELAKDFDGKVDKEIDETLDKVNPRFDRTKSAYRENCTSVVQATEIRRRGSDVEAGPLEKNLRKDEGGPGGQPLSVIEQAWDRRFTPATKSEIDEAFKQPGSRGVVAILWNGPGGGGHVFNVENVGGNVRYLDGQPTPPVADASHYFAKGHSTEYLRLDDCSTPPDRILNRFLEP
jgi:hypothetical protein